MLSLKLPHLKIVYLYLCLTFEFYAEQIIYLTISRLVLGIFVLDTGNQLSLGTVTNLYQKPFKQVFSTKV